VHEVAHRFGLLNSWPDRPDFLDREYETGRLAVATIDERVVAFAGTFRRGNLTHLGDLFVLRHNQSHGLGQALLDVVLAGASPMATFASADPRAVALYVRHGMYPRGVLLYLAGAPRLDSPHATVRAASAEQVADLDGLVSGGPRTADLTWCEKVPRVSIHATATGYAVVRTLGDDLIVGPAAGTTPRNCADVVIAAIAATSSASTDTSLTLISVDPDGRGHRDSPHPGGGPHLSCGVWRSW
jgi:GNAT superfamily N-acetyltransferase